MDRNRKYTYFLNLPNSHDKTKCFQGMYGLPSNLKIRFKLYLEIIPIAQTCLMYALFIGSALSLLYSIYKFWSSKKTEPISRSPWIEDDLILNIDRKLSSYIPERTNSLTPKELDIFVSSLIAPLSNSAEEA